MHRKLLFAAAAAAAMSVPVGVASASGPAPKGKEIIHLECEGVGPVTVAVPRSENSKGVGQIVGEKGHGIPVDLNFTVTDVTKGIVLHEEPSQAGKGHAHRNQVTSTCTGTQFEAPASIFFGGELPEGVSPTDIIRGTFVGQIIVKK
jgi:hypothetical protein